MANISLFTIACPVCGKGRIPYPFDDEGCGYCRECGASLEQIKKHWEIQCFLGKIGLYIFIAIGLFVGAVMLFGG